MLTGVAVGGVFPLIFSLLGDLFPASQRAAMASLVQIATGLGIGGGQMVAGLIGGWWCCNEGAYGAKRAAIPAHCQ